MLLVFGVNPGIVFMAPKFGNYLFRNLRPPGNTEPESASPGPDALAGVMIRLGPSDFIGSGEGTSSVLNWSVVESKEIFVSFSDTQGLAEGRITISADALRKVYPSLVPVDTDKPFLLSLRAVVLQVQRFLRPASSPVTPLPGPDFDTPISQVAREDENFHRLEPNMIVGGETRLTPDTDRTSAGEESRFPLIREKPKPPNPALTQATEEPVRPEAKTPSTRPDPFADLPKVGPAVIKPIQERIESKPAPAVTETLDPGTMSVQPDKPVRRVALERLQELFLTDDYLDAKAIARLLRAFPKVQAVLIMKADGTQLGGELPPGWSAETAQATPALLRQLQAYSMSLTGKAVPGCMLLTNSPVSIFLEGDICLLLVHGGRGLLPGMKERIAEIAKALSAMYEPSPSESGS
jgi:hypothetical protein